MKIAVSGLGYVGLSNAVLLAQHNEVVALDVAPEKVDLLNARRAPIVDAELEDYLAHKHLNLKATLDKREAYAGADFVIIATPTNYDPDSNYFDTRSVNGCFTELHGDPPPKMRERWTALKRSHELWKPGDSPFVDIR